MNENGSVSKGKRKAQRGASMIEFALLLALIAIVAIAPLSGAGDAMSEVFCTAADFIDPENPPCNALEGMW